MKFGIRSFKRKKVSFAQSLIQKRRKYGFYNAFDEFMDRAEPRHIESLGFRFQRACECCGKDETRIRPEDLGYLLLRQKPGLERIGFRICARCGFQSFRRNTRNAYSWIQIPGYQDLLDALKIEDVLSL
jgi:hypothetical protein